MNLHISLVGRKNLSIEIYRQVREAILNGLLSPGAPLAIRRRAGCLNRSARGWSQFPSMVKESSSRKFRETFALCT